MKSPATDPTALMYVAGSGSGETLPRNCCDCPFATAEDPERSMWSCALLGRTGVKGWKPACTAGIWKLRLCQEWGAIQETLAKVTAPRGQRPLFVMTVPLLDRPLPTTNVLLRDHKGWIRAAWIRSFREEIAYRRHSLSDGRKAAFPLSRAVVRITYSYCGIEPDDDGRAGYAKVILDALVREQIIVDDKPSVLTLLPVVMERVPKKALRKVYVEVFAPHASLCPSDDLQDELADFKYQNTALDPHAVPGASGGHCGVCVGDGAGDGAGAVEVS